MALVRAYPYGSLLRRSAGLAAGHRLAGARPLDPADHGHRRSGRPGRPASGTRFTGRTALGPVRFDDPMAVTEWQPPTAAGSGPLPGPQARARGSLGWAEIEVRPGRRRRPDRWIEHVRLRWMPRYRRPAGRARRLGSVRRHLAQDGRRGRHRAESARRRANPRSDMTEFGDSVYDGGDDDAEDLDQAENLTGDGTVESSTSTQETSYDPPDYEPKSHPVGHHRWRGGRGRDPGPCGWPRRSPTSPPTSPAEEPAVHPGPAGWSPRTRAPTTPTSRTRSPTTPARPATPPRPRKRPCMSSTRTS